MQIKHYKKILKKEIHALDLALAKGFFCLANIRGAADGAAEGL